MKNFLLSLAFLGLVCVGSGCSVVGPGGVPIVTGGYTGSSSIGASYGYAGMGGVGGYGTVPSGTRPYLIVVNVSNYVGRDYGGNRAVTLGGALLRPGHNEVRVPDISPASVEIQCMSGGVPGRIVTLDVSNTRYSDTSVVSDVTCGWGY